MIETLQCALRRALRKQTDWNYDTAVQYYRVYNFQRQNVLSILCLGLIGKVIPNSKR